MFDFSKFCIPLAGVVSVAYVSNLNIDATDGGKIARHFQSEIYGQRFLPLNCSITQSSASIP